MNALYKVFGKFWDGVKVNDDKLHATQVLPKGIKEVNNIPYTESGSEYHLFDVYYPENAKEKLPVIIDIHGGGWMYATKDLNKIYCQYLAARGFIVFNLSYRLVPEVMVPVQLQDISRALKKINEMMDSFPCDREKIMLTGDSAGGQLAAFTAAISNSKKLREHFDTTDHGLHFSCLTLTSPVAFMNSSFPMGLYCRMMWGEKGSKRSTRRYMNIDELLFESESFPPSLLVTSSGDTLGLSQTKLLFKVMLESSIEAKLLNFPKFEGKNLPHVFGVLEPYSKAGAIYIDKMCEFFSGHM
ncbi:MAG: alpha/beta hydrolase [Clostridia bacterium]|nr:alpha/beta hydrolase [Clostridia bacterium]